MDFKVGNYTITAGGKDMGESKVNKKKSSRITAKDITMVIYTTLFVLVIDLIYFCLMRFYA